MKPRIATLVATGVLFVVAVTAAVAIPLMYDKYRIPSVAMSPAIRLHDRVIARHVSGSAVHRSDIVVFLDPALSKEAGRPFTRISRVVAVGGDRVESVAGHLRVNGRVVSEPYLARGTVTDQVPPTAIPEGDVYMLGDNREEASDSRVTGPVPASEIQARVDFVNVPIDLIADGAAVVLALVGVAIAFGPPIARARRRRHPELARPTRREAATGKTRACEPDQRS